MKLWKSGKIRNLLAVVVFTFLAFQVTTYAGSLGLTNFNTGTGTYSFQINDRQGNISVNLSTDSSGYVRMHSFYANLSNENLLDDLVVTSGVAINGTFDEEVGVSASNVSKNNVFGVGSSSISGGGTSDPDPFDIGVEFETHVSSTNGIDEVLFTLLDANSNPLSVDDLAADQPIGIVFEDDSGGITQIIEVFTSLPSDETEEDNLLVFADQTLPDGGSVPVIVNPEPTTVLLLGIGLAGMAGVSLRKMRRNGTTKKA